MDYVAAGATWRLRIGPYLFEHYSRAAWLSRKRWGCTYRDMRGVSNCRTPFGAFFALWRWMRQPEPPPCE